MRWPSKFRMFFRSLQHRRAEAELDEELRDHLEQEIASNVRGGMSPEEAQFAARRLMGSIALQKEECRDARTTRFIETSIRDLRYAVRTLRRTPLFTAAAIVTLALGIGANTTIFTAIENILLRQLPVRDPGQLVSLNWGTSSNLSYPLYLALRERNSTFSSLIADRFISVNMSLQPRENSLVWGYEATGNYFKALGIRPLLGRFFGPNDDKPGATPEVVISDQFWHSHFNADPNVLGRSVKLNGYPFTIIGVAPPSFSGTELLMTADYWVPMSTEREIKPGSNWLRSIHAWTIWVQGRLKPDVSLGQAKADLDRIAWQLNRIYPNTFDSKAGFSLPPPGLVGNALRQPITSFGMVLMGISGVVLLLACINLAGMLLARASDRRHEMGIRVAVGAGRFQLLRQLMTESLLLAIPGGLLGFAIAESACALFDAWSPSFNVPIGAKLHPDFAVFGFALAVAMVTTLIFGLTPALRVTRIDVIPSLKNEPVSHRLRKWSMRDLLVAAQIALSVFLVIASVLVVRSLQHALSLNLGFNPNQAVSLSFDLQGFGDEYSRQFDRQLAERASALPGVQSAGVINALPLSLGFANSDAISRADRPMPKPFEMPEAFVYNISPGYLRAAGTRLLLGRNIDRHDRKDTARVALINEALAHLLFKNKNPLGERVRLGPNPADKGVEIVGVVETGKYRSLSEAPHPAVFLPIAQTGTAWTTLVARTHLPPGQAIERLTKVVLDLNPQLAVTNAGSLKKQLALPLFPARVAATVLGIFGVLAMVLAATGLFALIAYAVARRTREIGIRMALGARPSQVLSSVLRRTLVLCAIGIGLGVIAALAAGRLLSALLYGVSPHDPLTYAISVLLMIAVAFLACWRPALRAIRIDPASTLREQ
ncbi:MAG TPA: ABC transporter permease [Bryobacteraceae bacterium]